MSLQAKNVSMYYGPVPVLYGMGFSVATGEKVGLIGTEDGGKTMVMRLFSGFLIPSHGQVLVMGQDPALPKTRELFGYFAEGNPLPKDMRAGEYLLHRARLKAGGKAGARAAAAEAAARCGIVGDSLDSLIGRLSWTARRRIGLAEALLAKPPVLLLDDPMAGLEAEQAAEFRAILQNLDFAATLLLSSHVLPDITALCDRVMVLGHGQVLADGPTRKICQGNVEERHLALEIVANEPIREALRTIPGVKAIQVLDRGDEPGASTVRLTMPVGVDLRREVSSLCARRGWLITEMRLEPVGLDDILRRLSKTA